MDYIFVMVAMIQCKNQQILKILLLFMFKKNAYRVYFPYMNKHKAKKLMNKSDLIGWEVLSVVMIKNNMMIMIMIMIMITTMIMIMTLKINKKRFF